MHLHLQFTKSLFYLLLFTLGTNSFPPFRFKADAYPSALPRRHFHREPASHTAYPVGVDGAGNPRNRAAMSTWYSPRPQPAPSQSLPSSVNSSAIVQSNDSQHYQSSSTSAASTYSEQWVQGSAPWMGPSPHQSPYCIGDATHMPSWTNQSCGTTYDSSSAIPSSFTRYYHPEHSEQQQPQSSNASNTYFYHDFSFPPNSPRC